MTDINFNFRRGGGAEPEILYGTVEIKPTLAHARGTALVLPAPTKHDLVDGKVTATNVSPTPEPVGGEIEWAQRVKVTDRHGKSYEWMVGVPNSTAPVEFTALPRYFETRPPAYGQGPQGVPGDSATVAVGTVTEGATPQVTNSGTNTDAVLNFVLPQGPQGPKGDGTFDEYRSANGQAPYRQASDGPSTYPKGFITGLYATADGWPHSPFSNVTTFSGAYGASKAQIATPYNGATGEPMIRYGLNSTTWTPFKPLRGDLATTTANGLMSSADKTKLEGITPLANTKTFSALASTYSTGVSIVQVRASDGWPLTTSGTVVTHKTATDSTAVGQWLYLAEGGEPLYRSSNASGLWTEFSAIATQSWVASNKDYVTPEQFGALGDDLTDDTSAFQQCVNEAVNTGRSMVLDGRKIYRVGSNITSPTITGPKNFSMYSINGVGTVHSTSQSTATVFDIGGSPNGAARFVTANVDAQANTFVISGVASTLYPGTLFTMDSSQSWYYDPRPASTDARRSELHVMSSRNVNTIRMLGTFAESYHATDATLAVQPYHPLNVTIRDIRIVRDLPPVAEEAARHGLLRVSYATDSLIENVHLDGGTEYGLSIRNCYGIRVVGGSATNCNNYWTGYGVSVAGCSWFDVSGTKITNTRRGVDVTQGGKTVSRYGKVHDCVVIGGGMNSRGDTYGWNTNGSTGAQQSGMGSHGAADKVEYYNNTISRVQDPISIRGGNESVYDNTIYGKSLNGVVTVSFGGGTITIRGNKYTTGTEGDAKETGYNDLTSRRGNVFVKTYNGMSSSTQLVIEDNFAEIQTDFLQIEDASVSRPLRLIMQNNTAFYRTSEPNVYLINNLGTSLYSGASYRHVISLNRMHVQAGTASTNITRNFNLQAARYLDYGTSPATT